MRIPYQEMKATIKKAFIKRGISEEKAELCAQIHTESSCDGVYSHGLGRVEEFCGFVDKKIIQIDKDPTLENAFGAIEVYNGNMGIGICNAMYATNRAISLADQYGIGMVGLNNTGHWMRGGSYGLHASRRGYAAFLWTNSCSFMPPWGGIDKRLGNNPFVMSLPTGDEPVILDLAVSLYSGGKIDVMRRTNRQMPYPGGYDVDGNLSTDPVKLWEAMRFLPIGYWKGATFAFMLDVMGACFAHGYSTRDLDELGDKHGRGNASSQVFIIMDPKRTCGDDFMFEQINNAKNHIKESRLAADSTGIIFPGEDFITTRKENMEKGIPVIPEVWEGVKALA